MEKFVLAVKNRLFLKAAVMLFFFVPCRAFLQEPSQKEQLRIYVWSDLDDYPGLFGDEEASGKKADIKESLAPAKDEGGQSGKNADEKHVFDFAINRMKEVAPYLLSGMLYGWSFEYTPYDKARKVSEYWTVESLGEFDSALNKVEYKYPAVRDGKLESWVYCDRNEQQRKTYDYWTSITHPHVHGSGSGNVSDGFEGIKKACSEALKQAVRSYWRTSLKNKPKEIDGTVLLIRNPRVYIKEGQYVVDLDFFLQTDRILVYSYY